MTTTETRNPETPSASAAPQRWRVDPLTVVLIAIPAILVLAAGWSHRWTTDDGFINVRVVQQIFAGHGPVFNAGERVEVATSTIWLWLLVLTHALLFWLPIEWSAAILGLVTTVAAVVLAQFAAARTLDTRQVMPFAILAFIALPPLWDFTTSGLETGLTLLWFAGCQYTLVRAVRAPRSRWRIGAAFTMGLGTLVRPDLAVSSVVFLAFLVVALWPCSRRNLVHMVIAAVALPAAYEVFRAAYYGALVPNTAFAKEAGRPYWSQGIKYLRDFVDPYQLGLILLLFAVVFVAIALGQTNRNRLLMLAPVVAGLAHGFFVVRGGGDHMHARLLLPTLFALALPIAAIPRRAMNVAPLVLLAAWTAIPLWSGGPPYTRVGPDLIANERTVWTRSSHDHPVSIADYEKWSLYLRYFVLPVRKVADNDGRQLVFVGIGQKTLALPLKRSDPHPAVIRVAAIGQAGVAVGTDVYVADGLSLADPIGARLEVKKRGRPGHEKHVPDAWSVARFVDPKTPIPPAAGGPTEAAAARRALQCPEIHRLLERARAPLTPARVVKNIFGAFRDNGLRIADDPAVVAATCD